MPQTLSIKKHFVFSITAILMLILVSEGMNGIQTSAASSISIPAKVTGNRVYVRTSAGRTADKLLSGNTEVMLNKNNAVTVKGQTVVAGEKWYRISWKSGKKTLTGYMISDYIQLTLKKPVKAKVSASAKQKVRTKPGKNTYLKVKNKALTLAKGKAVQIRKEVSVNGQKWFYISFVSGGKTYKGYLPASRLTFVATTVKTEPAPTPSKQVAFKAPEVSQPPEKEPSASTVPLSDSEFEAELDAQGFPEDYKAELRNLHESYPLWQFKAFRTGCSWDAAILKENIAGKNLITKNKASGWKSYESGAYDWSKDAFVPYDGATWITASRQALEYYMDPRNFLTADGIFQFEYLGYDPECQTASGVESILKSTPLADRSYDYLDPQGENSEMTYVETFLAAAEYSQVNPFHLASRVKQEVVTSKGLSASVTGTFSGYEGYYNFFNIGATHSTAANGAVINGLKFAKTGNGMSDANKNAFLIPWNSPHNSIIGGAKYIGNNYITKGQNTVYLQKFNMTSYSKYKHQYMSNVEAPKAEAQKTYSAYKNFTDIPVIFYIPVYENMPKAKAAAPGTVLNPNNWLKTLSVSGCAMTPTFNVGDSENTAYTVLVDSVTTSVKINATSVSSSAEVTGTGIQTIEEGTNNFKVTVTAQNGDVRDYVLYVIKA